MFFIQKESVYPYINLAIFEGYFMNFDTLLKTKVGVLQTQQVFSILAFLKCQNGDSLNLEKLLDFL